MTGMFITIEGIDGAGKTTQCQLLAAALRARGVEVVETREPGGTPAAEAIRKLVLETEGLDAVEQALLMMAARRSNVVQNVLPALSADRWVVQDRGLASTYAYQICQTPKIYRDEAWRKLDYLNRIPPCPDRTLWLEIDVSMALQRARSRGGNIFEAKSFDYHYSVSKAFQTWAERYWGSVSRIDGTGPVDTVHQRIMNEVMSQLF